MPGSRQPQPVETPTELEALLGSDPQARAAWDALAPSHRREHARYITEAKKPETRERRAVKTVDLLLTRTRPT